MVALVNTIALLIISLTMLVRANDLRWKRGLSRRWNARLLGLMLAGFSPWGIILYSGFFPGNDWIAFYVCTFYTGLALVFVTTPGLPPWIQLIFKGDQGYEHPPANPEPGLERR